MTKNQARRFMLLKQGLLGAHKFAGKQGALEFIRQAGCVQFDPVDICGKNAEITLQARVKGFNKGQLAELLYEDRALFDYPDKQLSIIPTEYWAYFERFRAAARRHLDGYPEIRKYIEDFRSYIRENGAVSSDDFTLEGETKWRSAINWSANGKLSRSVLEQMYSSGDLVIHHKKGTRRYYDLAERHIPAELLAAPEPLPDDFAHMKWRALRRIGAVGMLRNSASGAWLGIDGLNAEARRKVFAALLDEEKITEVTVEGLQGCFYIKTADIHIVNEATDNAVSKKRCEFIAPLDPFLWDRKLIKEIFGFEYAWEIYTPPSKRKYGAYVLPVICGERFVGRIEIVREKERLVVKNMWYEDGVRQSKRLAGMVEACLGRLSSPTSTQSK